MAVKPSLDSDFIVRNVDQGFIDFIEYLDNSFYTNNKQTNLLSEFEGKNKKIVSDLALKYPKNNLEEFDFASSYKVIVQQIIKKDISTEYLNFSYKWFMAFLERLGANVYSKKEEKKNKVIDYPSDAFAYRGNTDTSFLDSNAYYSYL